MKKSITELNKEFVVIITDIFIILIHIPNKIVQGQKALNAAIINIVIVPQLADQPQPNLVF